MENLESKVKTGPETTKQARISAKRGVIRQQEEGMQIIKKMLKNMETAEDKETAIACAGIATGYANAMNAYAFITDTELQNVIEVIGQAGEKAVDRIEAAKRPFFLRAIKRVVRA